MADVILRKKNQVVSAAINSISAAMELAIADAIRRGNGEISCRVVPEEQVPF